MAAVRAVGTALVVALLITPAAVARLVCRRLPMMMGVAVLVGAVCGWFGLALSYDVSLNHDVRLASGPTIVVTLTTVFAIVAATSAVVHARLRGR